jgi:hypothetical protein
MSGNNFFSFANGNKTREFRALPNLTFGKSFNLLLIVERLTPNLSATSRLDKYLRIFILHIRTHNPVLFVALQKRFSVSRLLVFYARYQECELLLESGVETFP